MNVFARQLIKSQILRHFSSSNTSNETIKKLIDNNKVVVFMKGVPDAPKCGFSNAVVQILRMHGIKYDAHDVLKDETLRQGIYRSSPIMLHVSYKSIHNS